MSGGPAFLIVRLGALGDIVHALPVAAALRAAHPGARIDWLADLRHAAVIELAGGLSSRVLVDPRQWRGPNGLGPVVAGLRRTRYDAAFDLQGLIKSAVLARLSAAARVYGYDAGHARESWAARFYTHAVDPAGRTHVVDRGLAIAAAAGIPVPARPVFDLRIPGSAVPEQVRRDLGLARDGAYAVFNPGAAWPNKRWPAERFGRAAADLVRRCGLRSTVLWGPGEAPLAQAVAAASDGAALPAPPTSVPDLVAVLAAARLVVAGDTGPLHLAAALGTPVVGIYGPTDPRRNGPWSAGDVTVSRSTICSCPHQRRCTSARWCLEDVGVAEVVEAMAARLAR